MLMFCHLVNEYLICKCLRRQIIVGKYELTSIYAFLRTCVVPCQSLSLLICTLNVFNCLRRKWVQTPILLHNVFSNSFKEGLKVSTNKTVMCACCFISSLFFSLTSNLNQNNCL